ncbi:hypothetical protein V1477_013724 [Vespula maculifrons]|uniref:Uncharacterized protein n=1 Tax=Vespula maculifrons TaxID=7453 RepID=A0ABD2BP43_VESMC
MVDIGHAEWDEGPGKCWVLVSWESLIKPQDSLVHIPVLPLLIHLYEDVCIRVVYFGLTFWTRENETRLKMKNGPYGIK